MVPLKALELRRQIDSLRQSVDLNIRDLIADRDMPLPLATYLWCVRRHEVSLVNGDMLARWGIDWIRHIFITRDIGPREDEAVSAAALAAIALRGATELRELEAAVRLGLAHFLSTALDLSLVAFRRPAYAALLLLAAVAYDVQEPRLQDAIHATADAFIRTIPGGRLFGVGFLMELLVQTCDETRRTSLYTALRSMVTNTSTQYEDRVYALHALWLNEAPAAGQSHHPEGITQLVERELDGSPAWPFVMSGDETVLPEGGSADRVTLSPLYRAMLLDLGLDVQEEAEARSEARMDALYRGDRDVLVSAFALWSLLLLVPTLALFVVVIEQLGPMYRFFILHDFRGAQNASVLTFTAILVILGFLAPFAMLTLVRLWRLMIIRAIQSDQRAWEIARKSALDVFKVWRYAVVGTILLGLVGSFLYPALAHILGAK